jgi:hypothetical protein
MRIDPGDLVLTGPPGRVQELTDGDWHRIGLVWGGSCRYLYTELPAHFWCAEHVRQLGGVSPLHNLMEVKC